MADSNFLIQGPGPLYWVGEIDYEKGEIRTTSKNIDPKELVQFGFDNFKGFNSGKYEGKSELELKNLALKSLEDTLTEEANFYRVDYILAKTRESISRNSCRIDVDYKFLIKK